MLSLFLFLGTRANWKPTLCRTWLKIEPSRLCRTTSSSFTSSSKSPNDRATSWREPSEEKGQASCVCVCVYVFGSVCVFRGTLSSVSSCCSTINSEMGLSRSDASAESNKARGCGCEDVTRLDSDVIWHFSNELKQRVGGELKQSPLWWLCRWLIESVFILRTILSNGGSDKAQAGNVFF